MNIGLDTRWIVYQAALRVYYTCDPLVKGLMYAEVQRQAVLYSRTPLAERTSLMTMGFMQKQISSSFKAMEHKVFGGPRRIRL